MSDKNINVANAPRVGGTNAPLQSPPTPERVAPDANPNADTRRGDVAAHAALRHEQAHHAAQIKDALLRRTSDTAGVSQPSANKHDAHPNARGRLESPPARRHESATSPNSGNEVGRNFNASDKAGGEANLRLLVGGRSVDVRGSVDGRGNVDVRGTVSGSRNVGERGSVDVRGAVSGSGNVGVREGVGVSGNVGVRGSVGVGRSGNVGGSVVGSVVGSSGNVGGGVDESGGARRKELPPAVGHAFEAAAKIIKANRDGGKLIAALMSDARRISTDSLPTHKDVRAVDVAEAFVTRALHQAMRDAGTKVATTVNHGREAANTVLSNEIVNSVRLATHFAKLEKQGGEIVRRAEAALIKVLAKAQHTNASGFVSSAVTTTATAEAATEARLYETSHALKREANTTSTAFLQSGLTATNLLRDLRSGAFVIRDARSSMLTGRARIAAEMMELMHLLDCLEACNQHDTQTIDDYSTGHAPDLLELLSEATLAEQADVASADSLMGENAPPLLRALPREAAREALPLVLINLADENMLLRDKNGNAVFATRDGVPLKLDEVVWSAFEAGLNAADFVETSPLLLYGYDVIYTLLGCDGRTLMNPAFLGVKIEPNSSEEKTLCAAQTFGEAWLRALIERLKDDAIAAHNSLGAMLEESLLYGDFHQAVVRGNVEGGTINRDSFSLSPVFV